MSDYMVLNIGVCGTLTELTEIVIVLALKPVHIVLILKSLHIIKLVFEALILKKSISDHISNPIK